VPEEFSIAAPRDDAELAQFADLMDDAFPFPRQYIPHYFNSAGRENLRLVTHDKRIVAGMAILPMGQFFGGRSVRMGGIGMVATAPEARGSGVASRLFRSVLDEQYRLGTPLLVGHPAEGTVPLYRRSGAELAGASPVLAIPTQRIDISDAKMPMRPVTPEDEPAIRRLYTEWARGQPGNCDRSSFIWDRLYKFRIEPVQGYVVGPDAALQGYIFTAKLPTSEGRSDLNVTDFIAATPAAARRILTFLADWRMQRKRVLMRTTLNDPIFCHLAENPAQIHMAGTWLLRLIDVRQALTQRGYPAHLATELHLAIKDDALPQNAGRFVLRVADGRGQVEAGGRGTFALDVRGLAAMYTGYLLPAAVVLAGLGSAQADDLAAAEAIFTGPAPWMRDGF
jgi:predicted acetyltransferase